jgi:hypothetical protein
VEELQKITLTQLLVKAELDDKDQKEFYYQEIKSRNPSESELKKAHSALEFIRKSRNERASKPLSLGVKFTLLFFPFLIFTRAYSENLGHTKDTWKLKGYEKKLNQFNKYSIIGLTIYGLLFTAFFIFSQTDFSNQFYSRDHELGQILNPKRDSLGIPLIPDYWYTKGKNIWSSFKAKNTPYHKEKIASEYEAIDRFVNPISESETQILEIKYNFKSINYDANPWTCFLVHEKNNGEYFYNSYSITRQEADSILADWGSKAVSNTGSHSPTL